VNPCPGPIVFPARYVFAIDSRPGQLYRQRHGCQTHITTMDSTQVKAAVIKQVQQEANLVNARTLIEKLQETCFEKCVPKPGTSLSSGETTCMTSCMEKYMAAWNMVNAAYIARLRQESASLQN
ncbi:hypothetical protein LB504_007688, partial [Fusarium proliferatum]